VAFAEIEAASLEARAAIAARLGDREAGFRPICSVPDRATIK
jgi:hypothetical protein